MEHLKNKNALAESGKDSDVVVHSSGRKTFPKTPVFFMDVLKKDYNDKPHIIVHVERSYGVSPEMFKKCSGRITAVLDKLRYKYGIKYDELSGQFAKCVFTIYYDCAVLPPNIQNYFLDGKFYNDLKHELHK